MEEVRELRASSGVEGEVFERPEEWKRLGPSFLHPSQDNEIGVLEKRVAELERQLADALQMAEHSMHQLFELRPWLGLEVADMQTQAKGLEVARVECQTDSTATSGAAAAGIGVGDYIVSMQGTELSCGQDLKEAIEELTAGDKVKIEVASSKGSRRMVEVMLGAEDVDAADLVDLRATAGVEADVWERPVTWERMSQSFLHPSHAAYIEQLEAVIDALEGELVNAKALLTKQLMNDRELDMVCKELLVEDDSEAAAAVVQCSTRVPLAVIDDCGVEVGRGSLGADGSKDVARTDLRQQALQMRLDEAVRQAQTVAALGRTNSGTMRNDPKRMSRLAALASGRHGGGAVLAPSDAKALKRGSVGPNIGEKAHMLEWSEGKAWQRDAGAIAGKWTDGMAE